MAVGCALAGVNGVDVINVVHARRLKLSIIVVLAPTWNTYIYIFKGGTIISRQLTFQRIASHTAHATFIVAADFVVVGVDDDDGAVFGGVAVALALFDIFSHSSYVSFYFHVF